MNEFPWLVERIEQWQKLLVGNKIPHALLVSGSKGVGKKNLVYQMAKMALCDNLQGIQVCESCKSCQLFNAGNHTDLKIISTEDDVIKVAQIRQLSKDLILSSSRGHYRFAIIENAERMNSASANALLKTLEEPPANVVIILTTDDTGRLLPTIKSRCLKINIDLPQRLISKQWLLDCTKFHERQIEQALSYTNSAPLATKQFLELEYLEKCEQMLEELFALAQGAKNILEVTKNWLEEDALQMLPYLANHLMQIIKTKMFADTTTIDKFTQFSNQQLYSLVQNLFRFLKLNNKSLKTELLIEELLISWKQSFPT
ncbi:MAG: DNA polymerase III subunit delta' [Gammaproteobacteria bacterium]|jgi:DNA polymerase-3 subunit delta'|nr:DNA polymerase III subunit delta' [Xanthomonadales bacterium]